ncbi:hypothetical protein KP509_11G020800 [Ceratopteris richardii]|uniref:DUF8204 domain-containing protein n=1 Tax=Ceratopteris richardii TaxID=49495 RepID=A0A8T2TPN9_CERRI|nr:hypothetical protein KP509_11G020800 [Ceratopteris richardii]KAH7424713.1 hypothetical protein KP509_11G020800 [Ceratopteris richardii]
MVNEARVEVPSAMDASAGSPAEGTLCMGLLYLSSTSSKKSSNRGPICIGYSRKVNVLRQGAYDKSRQEVEKHNKALRDFKYACMGRSLYMNNQAKSPIQQSDLPFCEGLSVFVEPPSQTLNSKQGQRIQTQQSNEGAKVSARPAQPSRAPTEEFGTRYKVPPQCRSVSCCSEEGYYPCWKPYQNSGRRHYPFKQWIQIRL